MCRNVADAAIILSAIAGPDPLDPVSLTQPSVIPDYKQALNKNGLQNVRIGVPRLFQVSLVDENITKAFNEALETLKELGATIIDPAEFPNALELKANAREREKIVMETDFKVSALGIVMQKIKKNSHNPFLAGGFECIFGRASRNTLWNENIG